MPEQRVPVAEVLLGRVEGKMSLTAILQQLRSDPPSEEPIKEPCSCQRTMLEWSDDKGCTRSWDEQNKSLLLGV